MSKRCAANYIHISCVTSISHNYLFFTMSLHKAHIYPADGFKHYIVIYHFLHRPGTDFCTFVQQTTLYCLCNLDGTEHM